LTDADVDRLVHELRQADRHRHRHPGERRIAAGGRSEVVRDAQLGRRRVDRLVEVARWHGATFWASPLGDGFRFPGPEGRPGGSPPTEGRLLKHPIFEYLRELRGIENAIAPGLQVLDGGKAQTVVHPLW